MISPKRWCAVLLVLVTLSLVAPSAFARCCRNSCQAPKKEELPKFEFSWEKTCKFWSEQFAKLGEVAHEKPAIGAGLAGLAGTAVALVSFATLHLVSLRKNAATDLEVSEDSTPPNAEF